MKTYLTSILLCRVAETLLLDAGRRKRWRGEGGRLLAGLSCAFTITVLLGAVAAAQPALGQVSLAADLSLRAPAKHGVAKLVAALAEKGVRVQTTAELSRASRPSIILATLTGSANLVPLRESLAGTDLPSSPEALLIKRLRWNDRDVLLLCGVDDRGLMYAALEAAQQVREATGGPLEAVRETSEAPSVRERGISKAVMNQDEFESYLFSEDYWERYLDLLAASRYNNFVLMFGYSSAGYLNPPYPFLFDTEDFPNIRVVGITPEQQARRLEALRNIIRMTHERGMEFTLALWTHIWRLDEPVEGLVHGLTDDNLIAYTQVAFKKFLDLVPGIDRIQFRVHIESSLHLPHMRDFWKSVFRIVEQSGQSIKIDMRAKGFNEDMVQDSLESTLPVRVATKYWGEQMGLPYHPTHVEGRNQYDRRHGYADLLSYPKRYDMLWRLWNFGTTRLLLWGDPEYVRRFAESCRIYGAAGYEINEHLAFKMGHHRGPTYEILGKDHQHYRWEFERYWYFYQLFGRVGYNPSTPPDVWMPEFERRYGEAAAPHVQKALHLASRVLPRINAYSLDDLSADRAWAEKQRWENIETYVDSPPSDTDQFVGIAEAAQLHLLGQRSAKIWPQESAAWFDRIAEQVQREVAAAQKAAEPGASSEFRVTTIDLKVLSLLARYHARRIHAGFHYALFQRTQDLHSLNEALRHDRDAVGVWEEIVGLTDGVYHDNLIMGRAERGLTGHWKDELAELRTEIDRLERKQSEFRPEFGQPVWKFAFGDGPAKAGFVRISSRREDNVFHPLRAEYGWVATHLLPGPEGGDFVHGPPPNRYTTSGFVARVPNGWYELEFVMEDNSPNPKEYGPMWVEVEGRFSTDQFRVPKGQRVVKKLIAQAANGKLGININVATGPLWIMNEILIRRAGPEIAHVPVRTAPPGEDLTIQATVAGAAGIEQARLKYWGDGLPARTHAMRSGGGVLFQATIPGGDLARDFRYLIEVEDSEGRPSATGPVRVMITTDRQPPLIHHRKIKTAPAGQPLRVEAEVTDPSGVDAVYLRYRGVTQYQESARLRMLPSGRPGIYTTEVPAQRVDARWDFMYFIEAFDTKGNGTIYPDLEKESPFVVVKLDRDSDGRLVTGN